MRKKSKKVGFRIAKVYCTGTGTTSAGEKPEKTLAAYITVGPGNPLELDKDRGKYPPFIDGISPPPPTVGSDPPEGPNTDLQLCLFSCPVKDIVFPNCSVYPVDAFLAGGIEPRVEKIQDLLNEFSAAAGSPPMFPERPTTMSPLSHGVFGLATAARLQEIMLPLLSKLQKAIKELADIYLDCNYSELFPPAVPIPGTDPPKYRGMPLINLPPVPADTGSIFPGGTITLQANPTMPGGAELNNFIHGLPNLLQGGLFAALGAPQHFNEIPPLFEGGATFLEDALGIANLATTNPGLPGMQKGMESNCIKLGNPLGPGVSLGNWSDSRGAYIPPGSLNGQFPPQIVKGDFTTKRQNPFSSESFSVPNSPTPLNCSAIL